jgi:hypothetical protein
MITCGDSNPWPFDPFLDSPAVTGADGGQPPKKSALEERPNCAPERNPDGSPRKDYTGLKLPGGKPTAENVKVAVCGSPGPNEFQSAATQAEGRKPMYTLPSGNVSYEDFADICFHDLGKMGILFMQGSKIVEVVKDDGNDAAHIAEVTVNGLRSRVEKLGTLRIYRKRGEDYLIAPHARCSEQTAKAIYTTAAVRRHLPRIALTVNCPLITNNAL